MTTKNSFGPSATGGSATTIVGGTVNGTASASAQVGDATTTINGTAINANASTGGTASQFASTTTYSGKVAASTATGIGGLPLPAIASSTSTSTSTATGGKASVIVDSTDLLKTAGTAGVSNSVTALGRGGAAITVTSGSIVGGSASAFSSGFANTTGTTTSTYAAGVLTGTTSDSSSTLAGTSATVTNAGTIQGSVTASGTTAATIANTGKIGSGGSLFAVNAIGTNVTSKGTDTGINNAAIENKVTTTTNTAVGGVAQFTNAAGALARGQVTIAGGTGTVTNNGTLVGTTVLGAAIGSYTSTVTNTATSTTTLNTLPTALFAQTYTVNQNGTSGGFTVVDPRTTLPGDTTTTKVTNINATINLNDGSVTLGNIAGAVDKTNARLTTTTVNLNGSGYLGLDGALPTPNSANQTALYTPEATLTKDATTYFGAFPVGVTVSGVTALNKTGSGTFVISGVPYVPSTNPGVLPSYSLNVGAFNITGGEVQLAVVDGGTAITGTNATRNSFGINGDVNNGGSLVIGRRVPPAASLTTIVGSNLTGNGEHVAGTTLVVNGNYTQTAAGTTVVGVTPSLVRAVPLSVLPVGLASDTLGVVSPLVTVGYFTTVPNALAAGLYTGASNSKINVTGNVTLAGNVVVDVSRDGLYANGDGTTLFTYTGTADVSKASATASLASPFVKFALVNDATAKTVSLTASRSSFTTATTNSNAAAAAAGLDSAISTIVSRIRNDASGGAAFANTSEIAYAQDLANIVSALDFRLNGAQAAEVFNELASGALYGSLSAVNQNVVFGNSVNQLAARRAYGQGYGVRLWANPVGNFARYGGGGKYGAPDIRVDSYGAATGVDFAYSETGAFGFGGAYGEHDVNVRGNPDRAHGRTYTLGGYLTQGFGDFYVNATVAYGFTKFRATRQLALLARTASGAFNANEFDGTLEGGYDFRPRGGDLVVTPFAKAVLRHYTMNGLIESGAGGAGLAVDKRTKSIFQPELGIRIGEKLDVTELVSIRPYGKVSYTFQGDIGGDRSVRFLGGGDSFVLRGVDPKGFGTVEAGLDGSINERVGVFLSGGYSFGGHNKTGTIRGGVGFKF